jgi:class 3 adenylate cyclase
MFCDLVGSTSIAAILDAEEWRDLVGGYLVAASASVTEMGGHVAKKLGDGLLALFGYPVAQENDDMLRHACGFKLANDNRRAEIAGEMLPGANRIRSRLSATNICLSIGAMQAACERAKKMPAAFLIGFPVLSAKSEQNSSR